MQTAIQGACPQCGACDAELLLQRPMLCSIRTPCNTFQVCIARTEEQVTGHILTLFLAACVEQGYKIWLTTAQCSAVPDTDDDSASNQAATSHCKQHKPAKSHSSDNGVSANGRLITCSKKIKP